MFIALVIQIPAVSAMSTGAKNCLLLFDTLYHIFARSCQFWSTSSSSFNHKQVFFIQGIFSISDNMYMKLLKFAAKTSSCLNPIVFAISHPKFREAIAKEIPCLGIGRQHLNLRAIQWNMPKWWFDMTWLFTGDKPKDSGSNNTEAVKTETC